MDHLNFGIVGRIKREREKMRKPERESEVRKRKRGRKEKGTPAGILMSEEIMMIHCIMNPEKRHN